MKLLLCTLLLFTLLPQSFCSAAAQPNPLDELKASHEKSIQNIDVVYQAERKKLNDIYNKHLIKIVEQARADGDLDLLIKMKEEQKRFLKEQSVPSTPPSDLNPQLAKVQAGYNKAVSGLNVDKARGVLNPLSQHIKRLEGLKQAYVKKGAIEDALGVKAVLDGAKEEYRLVRATIRETAVKANDAMKIPEPGKAKWISKDATYKASSMYKGGDVSLTKPSPALLSYEGPRLHRNFNVHTQNTTEKNPHIIIDLGKLKTINRIYIENRTGGGMENRAKELTVWISPYEKFNQRFIWQAEEVKTAWTVDLEKPEKARYIKIGLLGKRKNLHLNHVKIYGFENPASPK